MNSTQIQTTLAPLVTLLGGLLALKVPYFDAGTWGQILGGIIGFGSLIWTAIVTRNTAVISQAAALPEVQSIKLEPTAAKATVDATPANVNK